MCSWQAEYSRTSKGLAHGEVRLDRITVILICCDYSKSGDRDLIHGLMSLQDEIRSKRLKKL